MKKPIKKAPVQSSTPIEPDSNLEERKLLSSKSSVRIEEYIKLRDEWKLQAVIHEPYTTAAHILQSHLLILKANNPKKRYRILETITATYVLGENNDQ